MSPLKWSPSEKLVWTLAAFILGACFCLVYPVGKYAVDDDWIFMKALHHFHEEGDLRVLGFNPMSAVGHLWWGRLFTGIFAFSFTVAKLSVLTLAILECVALIAVLRLCAVPDSWRIAAAIALWFNPLHFFHSFSYATDVPALTWGLLALLFYTRWIGQNTSTGTKNLLLASSFATLAFLVRQSGVLVPLAFFLYLALDDRHKLQQPRVLLSAFGIPVAGVFGFSYWYLFLHGPTSAFIRSSQTIRTWLLHPDPVLLAMFLFFIFMYLGFFLSPLTLAASLKGLKSQFRKTGKVFWGILLFTLLFFVLVQTGPDISFPYLANKLTPFGFLSPNEIILGDRPVVWGTLTSHVLGFLCLFSFLIFSLCLTSIWHQPQSRCPKVRLVGILLTVQIAYLLATLPILFDRHLLLLLPTSLVLFALIRTPELDLSWMRFAVMAIPMAIYGVAGTHDLHAVSRAAFAAGESLIRQGIDPRFIDAGYAFDGWMMYERSQSEGVSHWRAHDGWWVRDLNQAIHTKYVVSLSPTITRLGPMRFWRAHPDFSSPDLSNYRVIDTLPFRKYWPFEKSKVFVMEEFSTANFSPDSELPPLGAPKIPTTMNPH